jgi:hypothetical protein
MDTTQETIDWLPEHSREAIARGWEIFHCDDGSFQLQALDDHSLLWPELITKKRPFHDDKAAWRHVWQRARQGRKLEQHALEFLRQRSPAEYSAIRCFCTF